LSDLDHVIHPTSVGFLSQKQRERWKLLIHSSNQGKSATLFPSTK